MKNFEIVLNWEADDIDSAILSFRRQFPKLKEKMTMCIDVDKFDTIAKNLETKDNLVALLNLAGPYIDTVPIDDDTRHHTTMALTNIKNSIRVKKHKG